MFQLFINTMGRTDVFDISNNVTIKNIKDFVYKRRGIPVSNQIVMYGGKNLDEFKTLNHYNISKESTIYVTLTGLKGGMPKKKKYSNAKRLKSQKEDKRVLEFKTDGQEYGYIIKLLGDSRAEVFCYDGKKRIGTIRGKLKKRCWIVNGDHVLVSLRDYQDDKCDIIFKYFSSEVRNLKIYNEIPDITNIGEFETEKECSYVFEAKEE